MGRHGRFENLRIGPSLSNQIGTADSNLEASQVPRAVSNGGIAHDLECPLTTPFCVFCTTIHSFATGEPRLLETSNLVTDVP